MALRTVTVKLDDEVVSLLDSISRKLGYNYRSDVIREALEDWLRRHGFKVNLSISRPKHNDRGLVFEVEV